MSSRKLGWLLFGLFVFALVMGPGPGNLLVNPDPNDPETRRFIFGMPIIYVWAVFWCGIQAACVAVAYCKIWRESPGGTESEPETDPGS